MTNYTKTKLTKNGCKAQTKAGKPCRAAAMEGGRCFFHGNPDKASEWGRIGGSRSKRHAASENADPLPPLDNVIGVKARLESMVDDLHSRRLDPRVATAMVSVLTLQMRVIEVTDIGRKVEELWVDKAKKDAAGSKDIARPPDSDSPDEPTEE